VASGEEGGRRTEAPRDESEGQGFQVSIDPDRVAHSPAGSLLQVEAADPTYVQVRLCDGVYSNSMMLCITRLQNWIVFARDESMTMNLSLLLFSSQHYA
jgi:hypothetical protein